MELKNISVNELIKTSKALDNPLKIKILNFCSEKEHNMSEIKKHFNKRFATITNYIKLLKNARLIETREFINEKGKQIMIKSLYKIAKQGIIQKI
jgi:predicted transcriptional regulator